MNLGKTARVCGAFAAGMSVAVAVGAAELNLKIESIAEKGDIHLYVFTSPDGFPKEEMAAVHRVFPRPEAGQSQLDIRLGVPDAAEYAVLCFQDTNADGKMNRLLGMIPQEPYGLSRNPALFGKPKFSEAAFRPADDEQIVIKLRD